MNKTFNKISALNFLTFSYALFSLTVNTPVDKTDVYSWIWRIGFKSRIYIIYCMLLSKNRSLKPIVSNIVAVYIIFLIAKQIADITHYMGIYHNSALSTCVVSLILILIFVSSDNDIIIRTAYPLWIMTVLSLMVLFLFNINKATPYNLYSISTVKLYNVTLFDYFVPMIIILNNLELNFKNTAFSNILTVALANIFLIIFSFSVFSGNYLYSISPLQALFQISGTDLIRNFDAMYSFFVLFMYFGTLSMLLWAYKILTIKNKVTQYGFLFLMIPFLFFNTLVSKFLVIVEMFVVVIIFWGRKENDKT